MSSQPEPTNGVLVKYDAAKKALAEAQCLDEVRDIRDKAVAVRLYALQARDRVLVDLATDIRLRAERRAGELLRDMEKNKGARGQLQGRNSSGGSKTKPPEDPTPRLRDLGVGKSQSSRWQKLAAMSEKDFEDVVIRGQQKARAAIDRAQQKPKARLKKQSTKRDAADISADCVREVESIVRSAVSKLDDEERAGLSQQLKNAIRAIMDEAAGREKVGNGHGVTQEENRWKETQ